MTIAAIAIFTILYLLIIKLNMGIAGITLSTSIITLVNAILLGLFIHKRIHLNYQSLFKNFGKMFAAGALTFVLCLFAGIGFDKIELPKYIFEGVKIILVSGICISVYTILNLLFKMEYAGELINRITKR